MLLQGTPASSQTLGVVRVELDVKSGCRLLGPHVNGWRLTSTPKSVRFEAVPRAAILEYPPGTAFQLQVNAGLYADAAGQPQLRQHISGAANGTEEESIPYRLFSDAQGLEPFLPERPVDRQVPASGQIELPLFASAANQESTPPAGMYRDTLRLTLIW